LITLDVLGVLLRGTYHQPHQGSSDLQSALDKKRPVGIVFVNSLSLPRSATGDSAVYWAESFAEYGYPCFRLDMSGLGDSDGDIPSDLLRFINLGGYAGLVSAAVEKIIDRFGLSGAVIVGHCAGTVSALYAAAASKDCRGVVLMDPYFYLLQAVRSEGLISRVYDRLKKVQIVLRKGTLPGNANFPLLDCWKQLVSRGLPVLIMNSPAFSNQSRASEFDYLKYVLRLAAGRSPVVVRVIEGTDHSFANRVGRLAVRQHTENWLQTHFPHAISGEPTLNSSHRTEEATTISEANSMTSIPMHQSGGGN
jgi:pimeloyl-ACP methyl ester carboxylesterase